MRRAQRQAAEARGRRAETLAAAMLRLKGYRILARRARTGAGEIDLVASRGGLLVFVEVKARRTQESADAAIAPRDRARLVRAAAAWRAHAGVSSAQAARFDLVLITPGRWPRHVRAAIAPSDAEAAVYG